jgi:AcrR family transcriptional regulator
MSRAELPTAGGHRRLTRAETKARTRVRLVEAACEVFAEKGYAAGSVEEIADRAGFTIGAVYSNFGNKEGLFLAALEAHYEEDLEQIRALCASIEPMGEGLEAVARFIDTDQHRRWWLLATECWLQAMRNDAIREGLVRLEAKCRDGIAEIITQEFGSLDPALGDATDFASIAIGLTRGLVMQRLLDPDAVDEHMLANALARLFATRADADHPTGGGS